MECWVEANSQSFIGLCFVALFWHREILETNRIIMKSYYNQIILGAIVAVLFCILHFLMNLAGVNIPGLSFFIYALVLVYALNDNYKHNIMVGKNCCFFNFKSSVIIGVVVSIMIAVITLLLHAASGNGNFIEMVSFIPVPDVNSFVVISALEILLTTLIASFALMLFWKDTEYDHLKGFYNRFIIKV